MFGFCIGLLYSHRAALRVGDSVNLGDLLQVASTILIGVGVAVFFSLFQNIRQKQGDLIVSLCSHCHEALLKLEQHLDQEWKSPCDDHQAKEIQFLLRRFTNSYDLLKSGLDGSELGYLKLDGLFADIQALREEVTDPLVCHKPLDAKAIAGKTHRCKQTLNMIILQVHSGPM